MLIFDLVFNSPYIFFSALGQGWPTHWTCSASICIVYLSYLDIQFSCSVTPDSLQPHGLQCTRPSCPSPAPSVYSNSCPLSRWCHPTISSSVVPPSSCPQSLPASGSFPMSQFQRVSSNESAGQSIGVSASASVLPMNIQGWFPLGWIGWISLQSKGLSRVFSNTTIQKHQFFFLYSPSVISILDYWINQSLD